MRFLFLLATFLGFFFCFAKSTCSFNLLGTASVATDCPGFDSSCCCPRRGTILTLKPQSNGTVNIVSEAGWSSPCQTLYGLSGKTVSMPWNHAANDFDFNKTATFNKEKLCPMLFPLPLDMVLTITQSLE
mgnify:CR=1 FL=1